RRRGRGGARPAGVRRNYLLDAVRLHGVQPLERRPRAHVGPRGDRSHVRRGALAARPPARDPARRGRHRLEPLHRRRGRRPRRRPSRVDARQGRARSRPHRRRALAPGDAPRGDLRAALQAEFRVVSDGFLELRDGRRLAWREYGPPAGRPVLRFQGTPGSRFSRHAHEDSYERLDVRVVVFDRPGYGASTRLPGRGISVVADDAAELLDHLGLDVVHAIGGSGGGPPVLAVAVKHPSPRRAATVVVGGTPLEEEEDIEGLIELNRAAWHAAHESWDALYALLAPVREHILADPLAGFRGTMEAAPASDQAVLNDPDWQRVFVEDVTEAFRPG